MDKIFDTIIIGGGASGIMTAIFSAMNNNSTLILEHNEKLGKKLFITGKGRCNLTNNSSVDNHLSNIVTNPKFMYSALNAFTPQDTINFFESMGLKLKTERGNRVFPESDKSSDVIKTLENLLKTYHVETKLNTEVRSAYKQDGKFFVVCDNNSFCCKNLVLATGGVSYSGTGASDIGYKIAKSFGHTIINPKSALCPIIVKEDVSSLNGLSLKNVSLCCQADGKKIAEQGEMMFTFNSLTGPIALSLSSNINKLNLENAKLYLDLKPALSEEKLHQKFEREWKENAKKDLKNYLFSVLPTSFVPFFLKKTRIENKKLAEMTKKEREIMVNTIKKFDFSIKSLDNVNVGIVTSGGVDVAQVNSKNCMSKLENNLFIVGELLDVDALTGGYNLQIAWSTAYLVGNALKG